MFDEFKLIGMIFYFWRTKSIIFFLRIMSMAFRECSANETEVKGKSMSFPHKIRIKATSAEIIATKFKIRQI